MDLAISSHGRIDVLVNNAGIMDHFQGVGELSNDIWRRVLAMNLDGTHVHDPPRARIHAEAGQRARS